ncbi:MAG: class I SAM-dependent methyltransferase family protein [Candidatus Nitrosocaldus sp.]|nr:class I SAM-dependent methyltransferase family protein [Candidatus Nitrosocaldus sp.]MDW8275373.1 class I SAM-dependent methyltransferase family protein [Candidatus Nitrosocaldus sp.]
MPMLKEALKGILDEHEIRHLYSSFDVIGDIAIIKVPDELVHRRHEIGNAILEGVKHVRSVYMQVSPVKDLHRVREIECIAGVDDPVTMYKEHGCRFKVNVAKVYFSPRLSTERARIASLVRDGETVLNMFAGVCTFSIVIAKRNPRCRVYSIDINPDAVMLCIENARLNKVEDRVSVILGDAREVTVDRLLNTVDRVLMPLPEKAKEYLIYAIMALRPGGECFIHYFTHLMGGRDKVYDMCREELDGIMRSGAYSMGGLSYRYTYSIAGVRVVREVGPRVYQVVADIAVSKWLDGS